MNRGHGVRHAADALQGVAHDRRLGLTLSGATDVLQLTATATVVHIVRARWLDALGTELADFANATPRQTPVLFQLDVDEITRRGAWHEDGEAIHAADPIPSSRKRGDAQGRIH